MPEQASFVRQTPSDSAKVTLRGGGRVVDPAWIRTSLLRELPEFQDGRVKLESCHSYLLSRSGRR